MGRARAVIEVTASRLEVAMLRGGQVVSAKAVRHDAVAWSDAWPGVLLSLDTALGAMVNELGLAGADATVVIGSPTAASGVFSCGSGAGAAGAEAAARLSLGNICGFDLIGNPCEVAPLARDSDGGQDGKQSHALAYAERDRNVAAVAGWAERAGVKVEGVVPIEALMLRAAVGAVAEHASGQGPSVVLWVGEHSSVLAAGNSARLRFVRSIGVGVESLIEALTRPMSPRAGAASGEPVTLSRVQARSLLWRIGVPRRDDVIDVAHGLDGTAALPLLQPVLQRLSVEAKQSLRFGLSEDERGLAVIRLVGPGSAVRGLAEALGIRSGLTVTSGEGLEAEPASSERGVIATLRGSAAELPLLMPIVAAEGREVSRTRRWLHAGLAVAALVVAGDALVTRIELGKEQRRLTEAAGLSRAAFDAQQALSEAQHEMDALESRVRKVAGIGPAWGPTLVMLATLAPESVQLTTVELGGDAAKPGVSLKGFAAAPDATEATRAVKAYMDALEGLPLISGVRLEGTERGKFDGRSEQRFEIRAELVRAAGRPATASAEAKEEER